MFKKLCLAIRGKSRNSHPLSFEDRRKVEQIRAKCLPNEQLLQEWGFAHSEHDVFFGDVIRSSEGYWRKQVSRTEMMIVSNENNNLRVWRVTIPVLIAYGQHPEGFDLDKRTPLFEGPAAKMYIIGQIVF
jgi:hypothetical protein